MATNGKLEKLKIFAYDDPGCADDHQVGEPFVVMINPETYSLETKMEFDNGQASGTSAALPKFVMKPPEELTFEFLLDNTGIIDGNPKENLTEDLDNLKEFLMGYEGEIHQPKFFKFVWGTSLMKGVCTLLNINFKLFAPDGTPIRAICKVTIRELKDEETRVLEEDSQSPNLTHFRKVKKGDTLPLMCYRIYGHSRYYIQVAEANRLGNFRNLTMGDEICFPPMEKNKL